MSTVGSGASDVIIGESASQTSQVEGVPTSVTAFVGIAERGPVGVPTPCTSFDDYKRVFGGDIANGYLSHAVRSYFDEQGRRGGIAMVLRVVHYTDVENASTKTSAAASMELLTGATMPSAASVLGANDGPFSLEHGDDLVVVVDGGAPATAVFNATAAQRDSGAAGPYVLANGQQLLVSVDGGVVQTVTFLTAEFSAIGAATRAEVAAVLNAKLNGAFAVDTGTAVRIVSDKKGTSSNINVTGGSANAVLTFATGPVAGTGNVANIKAVTPAEVKTVVELAVAGCTVTFAGSKVRFSSDTTGSTSNIQVVAGSSADDELGLDNAVHTGGTGAAEATLNVPARYDGTYAHRLKLRIQDADSGRPEEFNVQVLDDGAVVGNFRDVTMDSAGVRYFPNVINDSVIGSPLLLVEDMGLVGTALARRPANGTFGPLTGGNDGLLGILDDDFIGSSVAPPGVSKTGMFALDALDTISILSIPDRATVAVHHAMQSFCEVWMERQVFPIMDPPANLSAVGVVAYATTTANLKGSSEFGAMYWPWILVKNPNRKLYGNVDTIAVPPSGAVAGIYARTDAAVPGGVYQAPAGEERGRFISVNMRGFASDEAKDKRKRGYVYDNLVNPLAVWTGAPMHIDGSRTFKQDGNFPSVSERRGVIFIEQSLRGALRKHRFDHNDDTLRQTLTRKTERFLEEQMGLNAFRSQIPKEAFFVDFGPGLNTPDVVFRKLVMGRIGLATQKPAEWIYLDFSQLVAQTPA